MRIRATTHRKLVSRLVRGAPRTPSPCIHTTDQRSADLPLAPHIDPPTSELADAQVYRGFHHRFGFPCHGKLAHRASHGVGSPRLPDFDGFC